MTEVIKVEDCGENIGDYGVQIYNAALIPENATNGEMIKDVFPDFEEDVTIVGDTILLERYMPYCKMQFHRDWWDAPYKRVQEVD